ncbi:hypothetical protein ACU4GD_10470 [Cupriavidus basilensis]
MYAQRVVLEVIGTTVAEKENSVDASPWIDARPRARRPAIGRHSRTAHRMTATSASMASRSRQSGGYAQERLQIPTNGQVESDPFSY